MEIGIDSFAAAMISSDAGTVISSSDSIRQLLERIEHADNAGLDVFGIGEHHRKEFLDSAPAIILAAAAARTKRIRLTSAVTVLSAADPVRVFQYGFERWLVLAGNKKDFKKHLFKRSGHYTGASVIPSHKK